MRYAKCTPHWDESEHRQPINEELRELFDRETGRCKTSLLLLGGKAFTPAGAMVMRKADPLVVMQGCAEKPSLECTQCGEGRWFHQYQTKQLKLVMQSAHYGCLACIAEDSNSNDTGEGSAIQWWSKAKRE